jgi:hypothetical protein
VVVLRAIAFASLLAAVACGGGKPANGKTDSGSGSGAPDAGSDTSDGAHSGTRLKLVDWTFADGTTTWDAFYDSERRENCSIATWADGNIYCYPTNAASVVYTDAACSQAVGQIYNNTLCPTPPPGYVQHSLDDGCRTTPDHLYVRGSQVAVSTYYLADPTGACDGPYSDDGYDLYYALGAEVSPTALVKLSVTTGSASAGFAMQYVASSDGAQFPWDVEDGASAMACYPQVVDSDASTALCAPNSWQAQFDHDASCTQPELAMLKTCTGWQYTYYFAPNACPSAPPDFYEIGSADGTTPLYEYTGTCTQVTGNPAYGFYGVGAKVSLASFARAPDNTPTHRMELIHMTAPMGSVRLRDLPLFDDQLAAECYPTTMPDGTNRCVPFGATVTTYYTSSACSQTVDVVELYAGGSACGSPVVPKYAQKYVPTNTNECTYPYEVHPLASVYTGALYVNDGSCVKYTPSDEVIYGIGSAVDPTTFALATAVTEQ